MRKEGDDPSHPPIIEDEASFKPSRGWAEMIKKVYQILWIIFDLVYFDMIEKPVILISIHKHSFDIPLINC